ncbi:MAG: hypothetical protein GQ474_05190 [Sulfurimonas sp.]|nr:hypothetical protein [Sulfurimonas sp.]
MNENNKEALTIEYPLASRWSRFWASMVDGILMALITTPVFYFTGGLQEVDGDIVEQSITYDVIMAIFGIFVFIILNYNFLIKNGQTIGKKILKIKIVDLDNKLPTKNILLNRYLVYFLPGHIPVIGSWLSIINILFIFGKEKRCVHDFIAKTRVVDTEILKKEPFITSLEESESTFKLSFKINDNQVWLNLKTELQEYYHELGFDNLVIDKETSWMLESESINNAYIHLSLRDDIVTLHIYNTVKPNTLIINNIIEDVKSKKV